MWLFKKKTPPPPPPPSPEFKNPWRSMDWTNGKEELLKTIKTFQPGNPDVENLRILLHGPPGAGKSSFIKSVDNTLQGRNTNRAQAHSSLTGHSFTLKMVECSTRLGVTVDCIYPIKNYHEEHDPNAKIDFLILDVLNKIIHFAKDHVEDKLENE